MLSCRCVRGVDAIVDAIIVAKLIVLPDQLACCRRLVIATGNPGVSPGHKYQCGCHDGTRVFRVVVKNGIARVEYWIGFFRKGELVMLCVFLGCVLLVPGGC